MNNNSESVGLLLLLILLLGKLTQGGELLSPSYQYSGGGENPASGSGAAGFSAGLFQGPPRQPQTPMLPRAADLARDFHRMVEVMGKVDSLGRLAVNPPKLPPISDISELANLSKLSNLSSLSELSRLSEPESVINTSALPDLSGLMEMMAPIMKSLRESE